MSVADSGYAKGRATRQEIVEQATALFGELGYRSASLREIASRCGISHPGLLHHFASKEALLQAVLQRREEVDAARVGLQTARGAETLARIVALVEHNARQRPIVELFATLSAEATAADHPAHAYFVERYRRTVSVIGDAYLEAREDGALDPAVDPQSAAQQLVALLDGLQVQWLLDPSSTDMPRLVRDHLVRQLVVPLPAIADSTERTP